MKRNKQFRFWLFVITPLFVGMLLTTAHEFNFDTSWLWIAFMWCVVVCVTGVAIILVRKQRQPPGTLDSHKENRSRARKTSYSVEIICLGSIVLLQWLASTGILPQ